TPRSQAQTRAASPLDHEELPAVQEITPEQSALARKLVADLIADEVAHNARAALYRLREMDPLPREVLRTALLSRDRQQRLFAADVLRCRREEPAEDLVEVTFETLQFHEDDLGGEHPFLLVSALQFLERHVETARDRLLRGLHAADGQLRFYCALVLAATKSSAALPAICGELISHLDDNELANDATLAGRALHRLGGAALPFLVFEQQGASEQTWTILRFLELHQIQRTADEDIAHRELQRQGCANYLDRWWWDWSNVALPMGRRLAEYSRWR
ncbi:MAG: hypothetical protein AAF368_04085, partial [Planctomycetota bacterium]